jgi:hypothetical protein
MRHLVGEATPELEHLFAGAATVTAKRKPQVFGGDTGDHRSIVRKRYAEMITRISLDPSLGPDRGLSTSCNRG